jgi:hypothetical protein
MRPYEKVDFPQIRARGTMRRHAAPCGLMRKLIFSIFVFHDFWARGTMQHDAALSGLMRKLIFSKFGPAALCGTMRHHAAL